MKTQCVFRVTFSPSAIRQTLQNFDAQAVARLETAIGKKSTNTFGFSSANVCRLQECAQCALGGSRVVAHKVTIGDDHTTEILRPRPVLGCVKNYMPNLL